MNQGELRHGGIIFGVACHVDFVLGTSRLGIETTLVQERGRIDAGGVG